MNDITTTVWKGYLKRAMEYFHHDHQYDVGSGMTIGDDRNHHEMFMSTDAMTSEDDSNETPFCHGMGMIMYMDGFQWTMKKESSCLNLYFPTWTLDTQGKFVAALMGVIILGILTEGVSRWRHDVHRLARRAVTQRQLNKVWYLQTFLHGVNALMAYTLMLATMTYSLEILCCVILGLMIGYYIFGGDLYNHAGSVCCQFFDEEDDASVTGAPTTARGNHTTDNNEASERTLSDSWRNTARLVSPIRQANEGGSCCDTDGDRVMDSLETPLLSDKA